VAVSEADQESHFEWLTRDVSQNLLNQVLVVVLEPDLAEVVGHRQHQAFTIHGRRPDGEKPEVVDVRAEHRSQRFLRRGPDLFSRCGHG